MIYEIGDSLNTMSDEEADGLFRGDEFAYVDYESLSDIQLLPTPVHVSGGARKQPIRETIPAPTQALAPAPTADDIAITPAAPALAPDDIEIYDEKAHTIDLYSINDADRARILMQEFAGDIAAATQYQRIIKQAAHLRAVFRAHDDTPEVMARQLVIIGQDPALFGARIVIPTVRMIATDTMMDRLRRTNPIIAPSRARMPFRSRRTQQNAPKISMPQRAPTSRAAHSSAAIGVQFPHRILARVKFASGATVSLPTTTFIPANTSVVIESLEIFNPLARLPRNFISDRGAPWQFLLFDAIGMQEDVRAPSPSDIVHEPQLRALSLSASDAKQQCARTFEYLQLAFAHLHSARATIIPPSIDDDFAPAPALSRARDIVVAQPSASDERLIAGARALGGLVLDFTYPTSATAAIIAESSFEVFWQLLFPNIPISKIARNIEAQRDLRERARTAISEHHAHMLRLELLAGIVEDHFGAAKLPSLRAAKISGPSIGFARVIVLGTTREDVLLSRLTPAERQFVLAKYAELSAQLASANPCEHVAIIQRLATTVNARGIAAILAQLAPFIGDTQRTDASLSEIIKCARCKRDVICPHMLELSRGRAANFTRQQERDILFKYLERAPDKRIFYCKICGELFAHELVTGEDTEQAVAENEEIANLIWRELLIIQRYVRARSVIDQAVFLRTIERHIYQFIEAIESRTSLTQTSAAAESASKLRIFVAIYIFADCLVNAARYDIIFDGYVPRECKLHHGVPTVLIHYAINKIMSIENVALRQASGITREVIIDQMDRAIVQLREVSSELPFEKEKRVDYRLSTAFNPIYALIYQYCAPHAKLKIGGAKSAKSTKSSAKRAPAPPPLPHLPGYARHEREVFDILPEKPRNSRNIYADFVTLCKARAKTSVTGVILENIARGLTIRAFDYPRGTANRAVVEYVNRVDTINAAIRAAEHARYGVLFKNRIIPTVFIIRKNAPIAQLTTERAQLSRIYDEEGRAHVWNILVFAKGDTQVEFKLGDASGFGDSALQFVSPKCSVCGILRADLISGARHLDDARVDEALRDREGRENLYHFFEVRCPLGGNHDFSAGDKCARCAYSTALARALDREWSAKYTSIFREFTHGEDGERDMERPTVAPRAPPDSARIEEAAQSFATRAWAFNYDIVANTASTFKVERADILAFGAHEGISREQIADGSFVARVPKTRYDVRIQTLRSYLSNMMMWYGIVKRIPTREKIRGHAIGAFIDDFKRAMIAPQGPFATTAQVDENIAAMPSLSAFLAHAFDAEDPAPTRGLFTQILSRAFDIFGATRKPMEIVNYYTESLCRILLALRETTNTGAQCCAALARIAIDRLIAMENTTIKSEHFDLSIVEGTKLASEEFEVAVAETIAANISDAINADEDDEESPAVDPLSLDAFDVDDGRDEDGPEEDDQAFIHIGDEVGW